MERNVYYIPGLGADHRLFIKMQDTLPGKTIQFPRNLGSDLNELAKKIIKNYEISENDLIIGFSFGGQIAKEIQQEIPNIKTVSISGIKRSKELSLQFKFYSLVLQLLPNLLLRYLLINIGTKHAAKNSSSIVIEDLEVLKAMAKDLDLDFFKSSLKLCAGWKNNKQTSTFYINAQNDIVIPYDKNSVDKIIPRAGHLLPFTHAEIICKEIMNYAK